MSSGGLWAAEGYERQREGQQAMSSAELGAERGRAQARAAGSYERWRGGASYEWPWAGHSAEASGSQLLAHNFMLGLYYNI